MKWMEINYLKKHSRIDYDCEDELLDQYGTAAEDFLLTYIRRTYENLIDIYGEIPSQLFVAVQMLVENMYQNRSMISMTHMSYVDYTFDAIVADFMRHTDETPIQNELDTLLQLLGILKSDFDFSILDIPVTPEIEEIQQQFENLAKLYGSIEQPTEHICKRLRNSLAALRTACKPYIDGEVNHQN